VKKDFWFKEIEKTGGLGELGMLSSF